MFHYIQRLEESQYWSVDRLRGYQFDRLKELLQHAYLHTSFYKKRFDEVGFDPFRFNDPNDLRTIPILTKNQIRDNLDSMLAMNLRTSELHFTETGGTTGVKIRFYRDNASLALKEAALYRFERWTGWDFGERMGLVWPATVDYVGHHTWKARLKNELSTRQVVLPGAVLDEVKIQRYLEQLRDRGATMMRGFTSPVHELAAHVRKNHMEIPLKGVITTGEPVFAHQRVPIQEAFQCKVYDSYRTREAGPVAQQCREGGGLHLNAECLYVEIENQEPSTEETGEVIITDLVNYGMPFIRYRIGDIAGVSLDPCPCGRSLPMLVELRGRTSDVFFDPDGRRVMASGALVLYLVDEAPGLLGQVQIIQDQIDHLIIRMTPDPLPTAEIREYQERKVKELFGPKMRVSFEIVDRIPREASGKYRFAVCRITAPPHTCWTS